MVPIIIRSVMSVYNYDNFLTLVGENNIPELAEWHVYGNEQPGRFKCQLSRKTYELKDHLGNTVYRSLS